MKRQRSTFSTEFNHDAASLVLDQGYSIAETCRSLDVGESALRRWIDQLKAERGGVTPKTKAMTPEKQRIQELEAILAEVAITLGRFLIGRLMSKMGLICKQPRPHKYKQATVERPDIPNRLNREFTVEGPDQVWCGDIAYIWAGSRWVYLAVIIDLYARRVVGWAMSDKENASLTIKALEDAYNHRQRPEGALFHSYQESQYSSLRFRQKLWSYRFEQSMSHRGNCWDNASIERLFRSLKTEWIPNTGYRSITEATMGIGWHLMTYYNQRRPHAANDGLPPVAKEEKLKSVSSIS